jgi:hypothetical protein
MTDEMLRELAATLSPIADPFNEEENERLLLTLYDLRVAKR